MTQVETSMDRTEVRPFRIDVPEEELVDLRRRILATRWPERETVADASQGVQLATIQKLARYWATDYDWRKCEAKLNALPQFMTEIDGLDIHFIHVRSKHENALPLIVTHGWPGSVIEQLKIIDPLTNPTAHGASAADAFHLVIPSLPGYGFSGKPTTTGWDPIRIARAWIVLMKRLGYTQIRGARRRLGECRHGADGSAGTSRNCSASTPTCLLPFPPTLPRHSSPATRRRPVSRPRSRHAYDQLDFFYKHGLGYAHEMGNRPQTLYGIGGFTRRPGRLDARPRRGQLRAHRARLSTVSAEGPDARRHPRQRHALLVDEHGGLIGSSLLGKQARLLRRRKVSRSRLP